MLIEAHNDKFMKKDNINKAIIFGLLFFQLLAIIGLAVFVI